MDLMVSHGASLCEGPSIDYPHGDSEAEMCMPVSYCRLLALRLQLSSTALISDSLSRFFYEVDISIFSGF